MNDSRNLILAVALSFVVLFGFQYFYEKPRLEQQSQSQALNENAPALSSESWAVKSGDTDKTLSTEQALKSTPRIKIDSLKLRGSLSLKGATLDDVILKNYLTTIAPESAFMTLLAPRSTEKAYYINKVWQSFDPSFEMPGQDTLWALASGNELTPQTPIVLRWESPQKVSFERRFEVDEDYLLTITDRVTNKSGKAIRLQSSSQITREGEPETSGYFILHEGPVGVFNGRLFESQYKDLRSGKTEEEHSVGGWVGITDKYWLTALIPHPDSPVNFVMQGGMSKSGQRYSVSMVSAPQEINEGVTLELAEHLFVGAKELQLLDRYAKDHKIARFDLAVDFGWFYFLTKPIFYALEFFHDALGNFGLAILLLTVCIKLVVFPLANKSYRSMAKMRQLQPELVRIKDTYPQDRVKQHTEMMSLYKKYKVNPLAGCLPIIVQIPVFFALYKVLFISIEMRHAPFYGWIFDLSAPDPTTVFNLFGLIPWTPPSMLMVGAWPILMGITMFLQQKLSPQPADPIQARVFLFMPLVFTFFLSQFAVGLVIYWAWNNLLSIAQQWVIMRAEDKHPRGGTPSDRESLMTSKARREAKRAAVNKA